MPISDNTCAMTLAQALQSGIAQGLSPLDAQILLLYALQRDNENRAWLLAHDTDTLNAENQRQWQTLMQRRLQGEPISYLRGHREFFGLDFVVDHRVLDPRPDTETLVQWALDLLPDLGTTPVVGDLGTGSGAIACSIAYYARQAQVWATDTSADALTVARLNTQRLQLSVHFEQGHWFNAFSAQASPPSFNLLVSNPPYIRTGDPHLQALKHEPEQALVSGNDGLDDIRVLVKQAPQWLRPHGWVLLEHGYDQSKAVQELLIQRGFSQVQTREDLAGIGRCSGGQWQQTT